MTTVTRSYRDVRPVRDLVTDEECYEAMQFLDRSAYEYGQRDADTGYLEYMISAAEAVGALYSDEKSADRRKWEARTAPSYLQRLDAWRAARREFIALKAQRDAAHLKVEVWRTIHADKRARDVAEPGRVHTREATDNDRERASDRAIPHPGGDAVGRGRVDQGDRPAAWGD